MPEGCHAPGLPCAAVPGAGSQVMASRRRSHAIFVPFTADRPRREASLGTSASLPGLAERQAER
jgi:hypothetical protein